MAGHRLRRPRRVISSATASRRASRRAAGVVDDDPGAAAGEFQRVTAPDPPAGAGDQRDLPVEAQLLVIAHTIVKPPLTDRTCPVIHDESGETRNRAALAMSCGSPMRPSG